MEECKVCRCSKAAEEMGQHGRCRECWRVYHREWRKKNPESFAASQARYFAKHPNAWRDSYKRNRTACLARSKAKRLRNPERYRAYTRKSYRKHIEKRRQKDREYKRANAHKRVEWMKATETKRRDYHADYHLRTQYGLSQKDYAAMLSAHGGVCAICSAGPQEKAPRGPGKGRLAVDHCHDTGLIRGLLCLPCNAALGRVESVPNWLDKATAYLKRHSAKVA